MTIDTLKRVGIFLLFCIAQALVLNRIQLFGFATPLLYVYFVLMFPRNYSKWALLLWSFSLGLVVDMFTNTPGVASASLTLIGAIQPYLLELFIPRDADENMQVSALNLGWGKFATYTTLAVTLFCLAFFSFEAFNFFNWLYWLQCIIGSSLLTILLILTLESVRK
ncbi:MAG: rod shape-determining protein MreD [Prevotella sp.]|nr:rod shape-determining protein MreD [Prevotella sp.]